MRPQRGHGDRPFQASASGVPRQCIFLGCCGGLLAHLITTISPTLFTFFLTFNLLMMIVVGAWQHDGAILGAASLRGGEKR